MLLLFNRPPALVDTLPALEADNTLSSETGSEYRRTLALDAPEGSTGEATSEQNVSSRPLRHRRPPQILTYSSLGKPEYQPAK